MKKCDGNHAANTVCEDLGCWLGEGNPIVRSYRAISLLQSHCRTAWNRGHSMGLSAAHGEARDAINRLKDERQQRHDDNATFTEEIMRLEAEVDRLNQEIRNWQRIFQKGVDDANAVRTQGGHDD